MRGKLSILLVGWLVGVLMIGDGGGGGHTGEGDNVSQLTSKTHCGSSRRCEYCPLEWY